MEEGLDSNVESRKNDSFYDFDFSDASDLVSLQPVEERNFVQELPDDTSAFSKASNDNFKVETFIAIVDGVAVEKQFLTRNVT
tara:strand:+ start:3138 stop:3386 length:249 start_codon:yes stop_codon:yes gene_type:complete